MFSLLHIHIITLLIIYINVIIFNKNSTSNLGSKYFLMNYIYHNHKPLSCFLVSYPFVIIAIYFLFENIIPLASFFISILHVYFLSEITSPKNIDKREAYIAWYKQNVKHSFSMHAHDILRKDYDFLNEQRTRLMLFKFEVIFFISIVIESEVMHEVFMMIDKLK